MLIGRELVLEGSRVGCTVLPRSVWSHLAPRWLCIVSSNRCPSHVRTVKIIAIPLVLLLGCHTHAPLQEGQCGFGVMGGEDKVEFAELVASDAAYHRRRVEVHGWYGGQFEGLFFLPTETERATADGPRIKLRESSEFEGKLEACRGRELAVSGEYVAAQPIGPLPERVIIVHAVAVSAR